MVYFFVQHKVHRIPGGSYEILPNLLPAEVLTAYTHYSFFGWTLIITDVAFDSVSELDFKDANLEVCFANVAIDPFFSLFLTRSYHS